MLSDSDSDLLTSNNFQNEGTIISARGPNNTNIPGISFRNNVFTSTMQMSFNNGWTRRAECNYDQRSMSFKRVKSPKSVASACDVMQRNYNRMSSNRSVYSKRGRSPMSMRSNDSNVTVSATDIIMAIEKKQFNEYELRKIQKAYNKLLKQKSRKRIEKRRNMKHFLKGYRRKSGCDSGELGSNSSISSDDDCSTVTSNHLRNISSCRSTKTDISKIRRTMKENDMFIDLTENIRKNRNNNVAIDQKNLNSSVSLLSSQLATTKSKPIKQNIHNSMTQKDRFRNGFLLPSQRFNRSIATSSIPEIGDQPQPEIVVHTKARENNLPEYSDEEIFSEITAIEKPTNKRNRSIDIDDDITLPISKLPKVGSQNMSKSFKNSTAIERTMTDFEFAKPIFPVRKSAKAKELNILESATLATTEKLISKSKVPLTNIMLFSAPSQHVNPPPKNIDESYHITEDKTDQSTISNTTDLSMRPSFIKRKLYTQRMDVTENRNKNDLLALNSPQNSIYGAIQKEKNKARKLVTSKYCLSRDIQNDNNNLLDLIHKIVPAEQMNVTNQTNKTAQKLDDDDKWDVTSIISTRDIAENVSETFTDEETIVSNGKLQSPKAVGKTKKTPVTEINIPQKVLLEKNVTPAKSVQQYVKSFWDCESDIELEPISTNGEYKENDNTDSIVTAAPKVVFKGFSNVALSNKPPPSVGNNTAVMNSTVESVHKHNNTYKSIKLCSHRTNKVIESKPEAITVVKPKSKNQNKNKANETLNNELKSKEKPQEVQQTKLQQDSKKQPRQRRTPLKYGETQTNTKNNKKNTPNDELENQTNRSKKINDTHDNNTQAHAKNNKKSKMSDAQEKESNATKARTQCNKKSDIKNNPKNNKLDKASNIKKQANKKPNKNNPQDNKKDGTNKKQNKKDSVQHDNTEYNNKKNNQSKSNKSNDFPSYSIIYDDVDNTSVRPVRSCRNKSNETITARTNRWLNRSLRSGDCSLSKVDSKIKPSKNTKITLKNNDSNQSDVSFAITNNVTKKTTRATSRLIKAKDAETSDVSFSLTNNKGIKKWLKIS